MVPREYGRSGRQAIEERASDHGHSEHAASQRQKDGHTRGASGPPDSPTSGSVFVVVDLQRDRSTAITMAKVSPMTRVKAVAAAVVTIVLGTAVGFGVVTATRPGSGPERSAGHMARASEASPAAWSSPEPGPTPPFEADPSSQLAALERALETAVGDPHAGDRCLSVEEASSTAKRVLSELGIVGWSIVTDIGARDDGCAVAAVRRQGEVVVTSTFRPEVKDVLETFRERSLSECMDAATATRLLTEALDAVGHTGFIIQQMPFISGPNGREAEVVAHAKAGCIFYTLSSVAEDGTLLYFLNGG